MAALLLAFPLIPAHAATEPHFEDRRFFVKGYEVSVHADGTRWIGRQGERRALQLLPDGAARFYDSRGRLLGEGKWDADTGAVTGIVALESQAAPMAEVIRASMTPAAIVETGSEGNPLRPVAEEAKPSKKAKLEFVGGR